MVQGVKIENGYIVNVNPATGALIEPRVKVSTHAEVDAAVAAAQKAQVAWAARSLAERTALVKMAVKNIGKDKAGLARMITTEMGKTIPESEEEVDDNADKDEYCDLVREANEPEIHGGSVIHRHPHGVVSICAPWNYPIEEIVLLAVPSLIAGNAVVVKPSEVVPLSSGKVVQCLMDGLNSVQPGLVALVQGDGGVGSYLVSHPGVGMCAFTGSTATGAKILQAASASLKPVVLECGGKDPMVVFADADLDKAAKDAVDFSLANCGQVCCAVERVYVEETVAADFERRVLQHAQGYVTGDGLVASEGPKIGPMVSELQRQTVHRHVQAAQKAGARCVLGGELPHGGKGTFYPPTVLADVPHAAKEVTQEETFGPVVALSKFDGADETAVALANDSTYGLTASVYSGDLKRAGRVASRIAAGQVGVNNNPLSGARDIRCPFVGHKRSGYGSHSGKDGWRQFSVPKSLLYTAPPPLAALPMAPPSQEEEAMRAMPAYLGVALISAAAGAAIAIAAVRK
jgi:acyl-CoA reductase-like NAD-dependent aldehyde dehydrogenase